MRMRRLACIVVDRREVALDMGGISKRISKVTRDMQSFGVQQTIVYDRYTQFLHQRQREIRKTFSSAFESDPVGLETNQFTRNYVWRTILQRLSAKHDEHRDSEMTEDELQDKLVRLLETKKSLIVLDDVWKEEDWDRIKPVFPPKKGWKVLLTSRKENIAFSPHPTYVTLKSESITLEESWTLFQRIAFPRKDTTEFKIDEKMEDMGMQMIKHCGGLPLAVIVLGGLLATQYTLREWTRIYENIGSQIVRRTSFNNEDSSSVYYVLSLSFEELPIYLKHCFLYLAHFPEDRAIDVDKFSYYLVADGIPNPSYYDGATIRDIAEGYIEELTKGNMVISERDIITSRFQTCYLHDMMREVCLLKAKEENFLQIFNIAKCSADIQSPYKSRRLVVHWSDTFHEEEEINNPKLRSILLVWESSTEGWKLSGLCLTRLQMLRVLDLSRAKFHGEKLPSNIGKLIHLRYLSLYKARLSHLPSSLRNPKFLLYLNLHKFSKSPIYVPNVLKDMRDLKYLSLPGRMHEKTKLELSNLVKLETLEYFSTVHSNVRDIHGMTRLETLSIYVKGESGCNMEILSSSLRVSRYLKELTIHDSRDSGLTGDAGEFVLDCIHLNKVNLSIYMPNLPDEQHFPSYLTSITLSHCCLVEDPLPLLEKLLHLNDVSIGALSFAGKRMVCSGSGFPKLQHLALNQQLELEEWIVEEGSMPHLHTLFISQCEKKLPHGLRYIASLKELKIEMMKREFKEKLEERGEDYFKVQHIPQVKYAFLSFFN
ncbi:hypothetical protein EUTSA_v10024072mg [Eutrema salsugineum]|uniref:Uncharacterized protein n=1 Tax=Eutrema salsugineum TaxID=72664 RepID=V4KQB3_EUTSA|nr:hypothetical protein EUTSA_v10024072mg [Eutrema salsugineum]